MTWRNPAREAIGGTPFANIFDSLEAYFAKARYKTFTVPITANTTNPTLGAGNSVARYAVNGKTVHMYGQISFGAGCTAGVGFYSFGVPLPIYLPPGTLYNRLGIVTSYDASTASHNIAAAYRDTSTTFRILYPDTDTVGYTTYYGNVVPWVWAIGDTIDFNITYETE